MKRVLGGIFVIAILALCIGLAQAEPFGPCGPGPGDGPQHFGKGFKRMGKELGLSADQQAQVKEIFNKRHEEIKPTLDKLAAERKAEQALIQADIFDEAAIRAQAAKIAPLHADMAVHRAQVSQDLRKVLTPEQFAKFKALQEKRGKAMGHRRGPGGPGKGPGKE
jgi:protein CpxP